MLLWLWWWLWLCCVWICYNVIYCTIIHHQIIHYDIIWCKLPPTPFAVTRSICAWSQTGGLSPFGLCSLSFVIYPINRNSEFLEFTSSTTAWIVRDWPPTAPQPRSCSRRSSATARTWRSSGIVDRPSRGLVARAHAKWTQTDNYNTSTQSTKPYKQQSTQQNTTCTRAKCFAGGRLVCLPYVLTHGHMNNTTWFSSEPMRCRLVQPRRLRADGAVAVMVAATPTPHLRPMPMPRSFTLRSFEADVPWDPL